MPTSMLESPFVRPNSSLAECSGDIAEDARRFPTRGAAAPARTGRSRVTFDEGVRTMSIITELVRHRSSGEIMSHQRARDPGRGTGGGRSTASTTAIQRRRTQPTVMALEDRKLLSMFTVTNTADSSTGSLRCEIGQADSTAGANTIDFDSTVFNTPQTITLDRQPARAKQHERDGDDHGPGGGRDGQRRRELSRVFQVDNGVTASLSGLTISDGLTTGNGGGVYNNGGTIHPDQLHRQRKLRRLHGGGLYTNNYGTTMLTYCTVSGNSASENGGGLFNSAGTTALSNCTVSGNYASGRRRPVQLVRHDHSDRLHRQRKLRLATAAVCTISLARRP